MPKRKSPDPVTEEEVSRVVKEAILNAFEGRVLDFDVARRGLADAAHDLIQLELQEVARAGKK